MMTLKCHRRLSQRDVVPHYTIIYTLGSSSFYRVDVIKYLGFYLSGSPLFTTIGNTKKSVIVIILNIYIIILYIIYSHTDVFIIIYRHLWSYIVMYLSK